MMKNCNLGGGDEGMRVLRSQYFIPFLVTKVLALRMRTPLSGIF